MLPALIELADQLEVRRVVRPRGESTKDVESDFRRKYFKVLLHAAATSIGERCHGRATQPKSGNIRIFGTVLFLIGAANIASTNSNLQRSAISLVMI